MGVEQDGLGSLEVLGVFYEIKSGGAIGGVFIQRGARGAQEGGSSPQTGPGRFITMKLKQGHWYTGAGSYDFRSICVDEEQDRCDKRRQAAGQFGGAFRADTARTGRVHDKTHGIGTGSHGGVHVLFACQAADLDAGARIWKSGHRPASGGVPHMRSFFQPGPRNRLCRAAGAAAPSGGAAQYTQ